MAKATIASLEQRQALLQREVQRYERLLESGAISAETLDVRKIKLLTVQQELRKAKAELQRRRIKLPDGELMAPFSGTVLEIFARPGERPGSDGVLSIGRSIFAGSLRVAASAVATAGATTPLVAGDAMLQVQAGVVSRAMCVPVVRAIFRATRGNCVVNDLPIDEPLLDVAGDGPGGSRGGELGERRESDL